MEIDIKEIGPCIACGSTGSVLFTTKNGFNLYRCTNCRHIRMYPTDFDANKIYGDDYFSGAQEGFGYVDYDKDKEPMRHVFVRYMRLIGENSKKKGGVLLDVGAATGFFAGIARDAGFDARGVEISDFAAKIGRDKGLDIQTGTLVGYVAQPASFDVITMWDVLEHFSEPHKDVLKAHDMLKQGGILAINTPDSGSLYARLLGAGWHLLVPPEHINYFNRRSARLFLEKEGFEVILVTTIGKTFSLEYILHIMSAWTGLSVFQKIAKFCHDSSWLSKVVFPINLFDNMFVLARKK